MADEPYTQADIQLVAAALHAVHCSVPHSRADDEDEDHARAALDALAAAGRLLPEGADRPRRPTMPADPTPAEPEMRYSSRRPGWLGTWQEWPCSECGRDCSDGEPHACQPPPVGTSEEGSARQ